MNVESTKYHNIKKSNVWRLRKDSNYPQSSMKYAAQNKRKYFAIVTHVTLFGLNNMKFNGEVDVIDSTL